MVIKFDKDRRRPRRVKVGEKARGGLVIDLAQRRKRSTEDAPPPKRIPCNNLRLPLLPGAGVPACVPIVARYVLGVREIAVKHSLKSARGGCCQRLKTAPLD